MKKRIQLFITITVMFSILLVACQKQENEQFSIVTTNSILYDITKNIVGDTANVYNIVPIGQDPHEYEVTPSDIKELSTAHMIVYNGLNLETGNGWFSNAVEQANIPMDDEKIMAASEGIEKIYLDKQAHNDKHVDPHAWLSLNNGIQYTENIKERLIKLDSNNKSTYEQNAKDYIKQLSSLQKEYEHKFDSIPKDKRILITSEGAFKYFSKDYGIEHQYIWEINTEKQGTPDQMTHIIDYIHTHPVKHLYVETSVDKRSMETLSKETSKKIYGEVYTDSIGKKDTAGDSYYNMMKHNINTIYDGMK